MNEFEVKFLEIDVPAIVAKLEKLGARKEFDGTLKPSNFDTPKGKLRARKQMLRLRMRGDIVELTFKQKIVAKGVKAYEETEVTVSDFAAAKKIIESLGYRENLRPVKHRTSYKLNHFSFEFDTFEGIPTFLEIEAPDLLELSKAVSLIELDMKDAKAWSVRDVLEHYGKTKDFKK